MTSDSSYDCDVLISGGGPTGVTLGLLLAEKGVSVIVVEKEADLYPLPRAAHLDHEVIRVLQGVGVADPVMKTCRQADRYDFLNARGKVLLRFESSTELGAGGWPPANFIHQPSIEALLRKKLQETPKIELRSEWELTDTKEDGARVIATCHSPDGPKTIAARYVVGADGARSPLRKSMGIEFEDLNFEESWLVIDVIVHDFDRLPKVNLQICNPERPTTCVLMGEGRHRWEFMLKPGETPEQVTDDAFIAKLMEPWNVEGAVTLERKVVYRFSARVAENWRKGRLLLAGDAAHQTPPFAGQGMAAGLRDADNLSWKLAAIVHQKSDDRILDSYQLEREPHVRATIDMAILMGRTVCITNKGSAFLRDMKFYIGRILNKLPDGSPEFPPLGKGLIMEGTPGAGAYFPQSVVEEQKLDDVLGVGWWLIGREAQDAGTGIEGIQAADLSDPKLRSFSEPLGEWLKSKDASAVLVRPDHYVFGVGEARILVEQFHQKIQAPPSVPAI